MLCHQLEGRNKGKPQRGRMGANTQLSSGAEMWGFGQYSFVSDLDMRPQGPSDQAVLLDGFPLPSFVERYCSWAYIQGPRMLAPRHLQKNETLQTIRRFARLRAGQRLMVGLAVCISSFLIVSGLGRQPNRCRC